MASPNSGSPWFRQARGLAKLRVSMVSPNAGSPWLHQTQGLHGLTKLRVSMVSGRRSETVNTDVRVCSFSCLTHWAPRRVAYTQHGVNDAPPCEIVCHLLFGFCVAMFPLNAAHEYVRGHIRTYYEYLSADIFSVRSAIYPT